MRIQVTRTTYPTRRVKPNMKDARLKLALNHLLTSLWVNESEFFLINNISWYTFPPYVKTSLPDNLASPPVYTNL